MVAIVYGSFNPTLLQGEIGVEPGNSWPANGGAPSIDFAVGAFTGKFELPDTIQVSEDWDAFAAALVAKTSQVNDAGIALANFSANRFVGVGGGGDDRFEVTSTVGARIDGRGGDDTLEVSGANSADTLNGGDGDDRLTAWAGNDVVDGGDGDDSVFGGQGDDTMAGGAGIDTLMFGGGDPLTVSLAGPGPQAVGLHEGTDRISGFENLVGDGGADRLTGDDGANRLDGATNGDTLDGGDGDDTLIGGAGRDSLAGGAGFDWISFAEAPGTMSVLLYSDYIVRNGSAATETDHATGVEGIIGSAFWDDLAGDAAANAIRAGGGDDVVQGLEAADTLAGELGDDSLWGGDGNDIMSGDEGDDLFDGGAGGDTADYRTAASAVTVNLAEAGPHDTGGAGIDILVGIEALIGSGFRDWLAGDVEANRIDGRGGQDTLRGRFGADTLFGAAGKDLIDGGAGGDRMSGGPGKDRYFYDAPDELAADEPDVITDLSSEDRILLTSIDAKADKAGNQAFELVDALTGRSGQAALVYDAEADATELRLDIDGDGAADGMIVLLGDHGDFTNFAL